MWPTNNRDLNKRVRNSRDRPTTMSATSNSGADADIEALSLLGEHLVNSIWTDEPNAAAKRLIDNGAPVWYQNEEGISCLHAAAYQQNTELVRYLIEKGAVWNAGVSRCFDLSSLVQPPSVDNFQNTAGDIALSFNDAETYTVIRDAGIRAGSFISKRMSFKCLL
jgi:type IV protein arginine methyltransferase